ncbi:MAG: hypothetical protein E7062_03220 [Spirochaetaceae bacterium]|nr:hypothetical protein [Spirochaetaceae bacterium]
MKRVVFSLIFLFFITAAFCFDWPVLYPQSPIYSYFGQKRDNVTNFGLLFSDRQEVVSIDGGQVLASVPSKKYRIGSFNSPLGNYVLVQHSGEMVSVYGNLESISLDSSVERIELGTLLGYSNDFGVFNQKTNLEFQIIDLKNKVFINPLLLLPKKQLKESLVITDVLCINKNGNNFNLATRKYLQMGSYGLYARIQGMPYKTQVILNGAVVESLTYDVFNANGGLLNVAGKKRYNLADLHRGDGSLFLSNIVLPYGKNNITILITDSQGIEKKLSYNVEVYR